MSNIPSLVAINPDFSVSGQLKAADIVEVSRLGYKTLINNRPDGEVADQPLNDQLEEEARNFGLDYCFIPVVSGEITEGQVEQMDEALQGAKTPVLAFCRSGTRCTNLYQLVLKHRQNNK